MSLFSSCSSKTSKKIWVSDNQSARTLIKLYCTAVLKAKFVLRVRELFIEHYVFKCSNSQIKFNFLTKKWSGWEQTSGEHQVRLVHTNLSCSTLLADDFIPEVIFTHINEWFVTRCVKENKYTSLMTTLPSNETSILLSIAEYTRIQCKRTFIAVCKWIMNDEQKQTKRHIEEGEASTWNCCTNNSRKHNAEQSGHSYVDSCIFFKK